MNRPSGAFKQTERSCESKMEGTHPDKLTVCSEKLQDIQVQKVQKLLKIRLDKKPLRWYNKQVVSRKAEAHRTLKIEQYRKTCKEPFKCLEKH